MEQRQVKNLTEIHKRKMSKLCVASLVVCFFSSTYGQADIRRPPTITKHPRENVIYRSEDAVTLECKAEGMPAISYEWKKNTQDLNPNQPNVQRDSSDGTITIGPATSMDEGFYQCFARNQFGIAVSNTAHIQRARLDSVPGTSTPLQKTVEEGKPFHIQANPPKSFPKASYSWETASDDGVDTNPTAFLLSRRTQIAENGDLHFAYAHIGDAIDGKIYKCTAYNPHLDVKAGGSYTKLTVTRDPGGINQFAPIFGFASEEQTVAVIGGSVTLRCFFYGNPEPTMSWTGPRNTLPIGRYLLNNFNSELVINNITTKDEGDYVCAGSNTKGLNRSTIHIRVEAVPRFLTVTDGPRDVNVTEGGSFTFNCNAEAKPESTIVWFQDGEQLDPDKPPNRFIFSDNKKSLTIRDVCRNCDDRTKHTDLTVIQCNASNTHGYAFASGYLNVLSRTTVTIQNKTDVEVYADEEGRVQLDCNATSDPSTPPNITWYKVEAEGDQRLYNKPPFVTVVAGHLTIHVSANAIEKWSKYLGQYRCVVDTGHSKVSQTQLIFPKIRPEIATAAALTVPVSMCGVFLDLEVCWIWVSIAAAVLGLFIIIVIICCAVCQRNKEEKYNVDKNERTWTGKDPIKEFLDDGFEEYQRVECITPTLLSSRPSFSSTTLLGIKEADREEDSLNEYMGDEGRFTEEGSFIGGTYRSQSRLGLE